MFVSKITDGGSHALKCTVRAFGQYVQADVIRSQGR